MGSYEFFVQIRDGEHVILDTNLTGAGRWLRWLGEQPPVGRVNEFEPKFVSGAALAEAFEAAEWAGKTEDTVVTRAMVAP